MDELAIKAEALSRIRRAKSGRPLPVIASEFSLPGTGIRADLAVLDEDHFQGIEVKSAADTLKRLPSQLEGYARYFDETVLVVAPRHLRGLRDIDLHGAEVWRQEVLTDWKLHSPGQFRRASGQWLLHLLTSQEERRAISDIGRNNPHPDDLDAAKRGAFIAAFRKRYDTTSSIFWSTVARRRIMPADIGLLSRFRASRQKQRDLDAARSQRMRVWMAEMNMVEAG